MRAQQQVEEERQQRLQEKKRHAKEQKKEEELQKQKEEETRKTAATAEVAAMAQVVSPGKSGQQDRADPAINNHLVSMMQGGMEVETSEEGDGSQSPLKNKQKKTYVETTATAPPAVKVKNVSSSFDSHIHKHQRVMVEAAIKLTGANPTQPGIFKEWTTSQQILCFQPCKI
jgi:hypothetical protein